MLDLRSGDRELLNGRAQLIPLRRHEDERGWLLPFDFAHLPFEPRRVFAVTNVPQGGIRGGHAHSDGQQLLVCLQGRVGIRMRHGNDTVTLVLEPAASGLLVTADVWCQQTYATAETVLLVFASHPYDPTSYVTG